MIKILEVNNLDLLGKRYNGYDMINDLDNNKFDIKQAVIHKLSNNSRVIEIFKDKYIKMIQEKFEYYEQPILSIKNVLSMSTPALMDLKEYQEADIIHIHMLHNTGLSVYSLTKIAKEKKVILSLHDPWLLTGRCVHFYDCNNWKTGCGNCPTLTTAFSLNKDNSKYLWQIKKDVFDNIDIDVVVPTKWMLNNVKESPVFKNQKHIHKIPFGIDYEKWNTISKEEARIKLNIPKEDIVLFHRAQDEFKGTPYVLEALKELNTDKRITILTCDTTNLFDELKDKYNVIDLGIIKDQKMIQAMNACDIFLMPSIGESFGLMAVEAMACAKPVIVFDNTAMPSVTHAPECGYLVKDKDSNDLRKAIEELVNNPKEREKRGNLGRKIVEEEYSNEKYNKSLEDLYLEVSKRTSHNEEIKVEKSENEEQFKYYLNDITVRIFGTNKYAKELLYKIDNKRISNYEYDFSDLALQELIYNYCEKLFKIMKNNKIEIKESLLLKINKLLYFIKNNPDFLKNKVKR